MKQTLHVADPQMGNELPEKLKVIISVTGELQGMFICSIMETVDVEGKVPALGMSQG